MGRTFGATEGGDMSEKGQPLPYPCECGCGQFTNISLYSDRRRGHIKGKAVRYIYGHSPGGRFQSGELTGELNAAWKGGVYRTSNGYVHRLTNGDHSRAIRGYVLDHILIAEHALGRPLTKPHEVHHVNGVKHDNRPENLVICEDRGYHLLLHKRTRALREGGSVHHIKCMYCKQWDLPGVNGMKDYKHNIGRHLVCASSYQRDRHQLKLVTR